MASATGAGPKPSSGASAGPHVQNQDAKSVWAQLLNSVDTGNDFTRGDAEGRDPAVTRWLLEHAAALGPGFSGPCVLVGSHVGSLVGGLQGVERGGWLGGVGEYACKVDGKRGWGLFDKDVGPIWRMTKAGDKGGEGARG